MIDKIVQHWGVDVRINGERVLTIEKDSLSGIENISDYADIVDTWRSLLLVNLRVLAAMCLLFAVPGQSEFIGAPQNKKARVVRA